MGCLNFYSDVLKRGIHFSLCGNWCKLTPGKNEHEADEVYSVVCSYREGRYRLSHTGGDSRYNRKRQCQATAQAERHIHITNVCTRTLATHAHNSSARVVPYMAKPRHVRTNSQNGLIQPVLRFRR